MSYHISKIVKGDFEETLQKVVENLKDVGFGVITEIDMKEKLKEKLDVDFKNYVILGACNPSFAHKALLAEDKIGTMLPCNIIVQEGEDGKVEVAAINPVASMQAIENDSLGEIASTVQSKLKQVIENV